jgi:phosphoribosylglycinamide formyltransferase-1
MKRLSIFVSGGGTNLQIIAEYFADNKEVEIVNVICNNPNAYAIERAKNLGIPCKIINRAEFKSEDFTKELLEQNIDLVVLAGFLWLLPKHLIDAFPNKIVNIHPALLPKYGGKGFYGEHVHEAVVAAKEEVSGITIHYVNECYDSGAIIFQAQVALEEGETADSLAAKIHKLEYQHYPVVIEELLGIEEYLA